MRCARSSKWKLLIGLGLVGLSGAAPGTSAAGERPRRILASSRFSIDEILARPYDRDVPMGCTGDRVWASSPQGWAFRDDVHWLYLTNLKAFDLEIRDDLGLLQPRSATYLPSHIHYEGTVRLEMTASASFTFVTDRVENPLTPPFSPEKRWTCWSSGHRRDWFEVQLGVPRSLSGLALFFFDDSPTGGCRPPESYQVQFFDGRTPRGSRSSHSRFSRAAQGRGKTGSVRDPVVTSRFRVSFSARGHPILYGPLWSAARAGKASPRKRRHPILWRSPVTNSSRDRTRWSRSCGCTTRRARSRRSMWIRRSTWGRRTNSGMSRRASGLIVRRRRRNLGARATVALDRWSAARSTGSRSISASGTWWSTTLPTLSRSPGSATGGGFHSPGSPGRCSMIGSALQAVWPSYSAGENQGFQGGVRIPAAERVFADRFGGQARQ